MKKNPPAFRCKNAPNSFKIKISVVLTTAMLTIKCVFLTLWRNFFIKTSSLQKLDNNKIWKS